MLVNMSSTNLTINILLEEALNEPDIDEPIPLACHSGGIAALWIDNTPPSTPPSRMHSKKGSMWGSISAVKSGNFIKLNRDWCSCSTPSEKSKIIIRTTLGFRKLGQHLERVTQDREQSSKESTREIR